jgi:imidazolonepropionase-like amidohydrolase
MDVEETGYTLLRAARVLTMESGASGPIERGAILLEGERIRAVGPAAEVRAPEGSPCRVLDYPESTILPGLVDTHTHLIGFGDGRPGEGVAAVADDVLVLQAARNARIHLESGVTTLRDCGCKGRTAFALREAVCLGITPAPRLVLSGRPITITGGHLWYFGQEADGVDGVRHAVRQVLKDGADFIKVIATGGSTRTSFPLRPAYTLEELHAAVEEAHRFGKPVAAHCASTQGVLHALEAGVDTIIHCVMAEPDGTLRFREDVVEQLLARRAWVDATLAQGWMRVLELERKARETELSTAEQADLERFKRGYERRGEHFRRLVEAGVAMVSGSDSSWSWYPMGKFQYEIIAHAELGMGPLAAIASGTRDAATCLHLDREIGTLTPGKLADILIVDGDPARNVWDLLNVRDVLQSGRRVPRRSA